ncbi:hypothetical protein [Marinirhabdus gelatinilytica]|uniref:Lipoprotein n=1 Tax=Marinirhabdus gelatinilytica TaxID=1703343 RepID=A0A370QG09_9FLAO|nr:hypothetical protein [Marinirhabdus gelatinilytica]RDK87304.1 hypothetical protein C8D94_102491 [Marinirhabdus gelatinilytica]
MVIQSIIKRIFYFSFLIAVISSCSSDDDSSNNNPTDDDMGQMEESFITFDINGETVSLTNIQTSLSPTNSSIRQVTADFPDNSGYNIRVTQQVGETGTFQETFFFLENQYYCSQANSCNVDTNTTIHTDSRIVANFQYNFTDTNGNVEVQIRNGEMDVTF